MEQEARDIRKAWAAIGGFACNQGFLFAAFYLGSDSLASLGGASFYRIELFGTLLCMVAAFAVLFCIPPRAKDALLSPRFAWAYAALLVICSLAPSVFGNFGLLSFALEVIFVGVPLAFLLCAWGRVIGSFPVERAVPTIFISTALAAGICMAFASMPFDWSHLVLYLLPLGSASFLRESHRDLTCAHHDSRPDSERADAVSTETRMLSKKVMLGTFSFGLATGAMETFSSHPAQSETPAFAVTFFLLAMFCLAALQLFRGVSIARVRDFFGNAESGPLDASYRLAFMVMIAGLLFMPALDAFGMLGESIVLAGYLGMAVVLASVFVVMGRVRGSDAALAFAEGFGFLYFGELIGLTLGNALQMEAFAWAHSSLVVGFAGLVVLYAYLFLFTDRDVNDLTVAAGEGDSFERACELIVAECALSKREAEVLPLALRGRTSERIAQELFISKNTVDTHMRRIYSKCKVGSRQELIDLGERYQKEAR